MKRYFVFSILMFVGCFSLLAQNSQVPKEQEKEEMHDDRVKNSHLNAFRDPETGRVDYRKLQEIHSFIDSKIQNPQKTARTAQTIPYMI